MKECVWPVAPLRKLPRKIQINVPVILNLNTDHLNDPRCSWWLSCLKCYVPLELCVRLDEQGNQLDCELSSLVGLLFLWIFQHYTKLSNAKLLLPNGVKVSAAWPDFSLLSIGDWIAEARSQHLSWFVLSKGSSQSLTICRVLVKDKFWSVLGVQSLWTRPYCSPVWCTIITLMSSCLSWPKPVGNGDLSFHFQDASVDITPPMYYAYWDACHRNSYKHSLR